MEDYDGYDASEHAGPSGGSGKNLMSSFILCLRRKWWWWLSPWFSFILCRQKWKARVEEIANNVSTACAIHHQSDDDKCDDDDDDVDHDVDNDDD